MAEPIEFLILQNLQDALQAITIAGGYHYDVVGTAVKLDANHEVEALVAPGGPRPWIVLELGEERWGIVEFPLGLRLVVPVLIHWIQNSTPTVDESLLQTYLRGCADVERAIAVDISRGGRATDTRIIGRTLERGIDGAEVEALIDTEIVVFRTYGQPDAA